MTIKDGDGYFGTTTNDPAPCPKGVDAKGLVKRGIGTPSIPQGYIGETVKNQVLYSSPLAIANGVATTLTSIALTPGKWRLSASVGIAGGTSTAFTQLLAIMSATPNDTAAAANFGDNGSVIWPAGINPSTTNSQWNLKDFIVDITANQTWYLSVKPAHTAGTCNFFGTFEAMSIG